MTAPTWRADAAKAAADPALAVRTARAAVAARVQLRRCQEVGPRARVFGRCSVDNRGTVTIGERFYVTATPVPVGLLTYPGGRIEIGDTVFLNFGCWLSAHRLVRIGDHCLFGPHVLVLDCHGHTPQDHDVLDEPRPVVVEERVWVGARVTVLPGVTIGAGSTIAAGSVVTHDVPAGVVAGGVPARVLRTL
jgi:maltose O-acetyltransferase